MSKQSARRTARSSSPTSAERRSEKAKAKFGDMKSELSWQTTVAMYAANAISNSFNHNNCYGTYGSK